MEDQEQEHDAMLIQLNQQLAREIAECKALERLIESERKRLREVLDMLPAYLILLTSDYQVTFANRFFRERFGESDGRPCFNYLFGRDKPCEVCETYKIQRTRQPLQWEWVGPDNRYYHIYDFPFVDSDGTELILEVGIDVTEQKKAEEALKVAHDLLEARVEERTAELAEANAHLKAEIAERHRVELALRESEERYRTIANELHEANETKNQFFARLSHELRNPLASIRTALQILNRVEPGGEQAKRSQATINRQVDQLAHLVDDVLDLTRIAHDKFHLQMEQVDLSDLISQAIEDHRPLFTQNSVSLFAELPDTPVYVNADKVRLRQVVGNLLMNAMKFTPAGGSTWVSVVKAPCGDMANISVRDTGIGMSPSMVARLFQPFAQAEESAKLSQGGLGLGLALVKSLVEQHGGRVSAHSDGPGKGSEFCISIPIVKPAASAAGVLPEQANRKFRRILIIDDNADLAQQLGEFLTLFGHTVEVASSGKQGIALAHAFLPDVLLCDIGLPDMDGYAVAQAFRSDAALKAVRLVALTGYALPEDRQHAANMGFDSYVVKPPDLLALEKALATASL